MLRHPFCARKWTEKQLMRSLKQAKSRYDNQSLHSTSVEGDISQRLCHLSFVSRMNNTFNIDNDHLTYIHFFFARKSSYLESTKSTFKKS